MCVTYSTHALTACNQGHECNRLSLIGRDGTLAVGRTELPPRPVMRILVYLSPPLLADGFVPLVPFNRALVAVSGYPCHVGTTVQSFLAFYGGLLVVCWIDIG